jgi:two-component system chemotaxis response regulator CheB
MIKVLIVEDSPVTQQMLAYAISSDPDLTVVGIAENGKKAIEAVKKFKPDIITMDWHMPILDGYEATSIIMETNPTPIVIVSGSERAKETTSSFSMIEAGALAIVKKLPSIDHPDYLKEKQTLIQILKLMSEVKLVKRISKKIKNQEPVKSEIKRIKNSNQDIQVIAIGASTGGPIVLQKILSGLPKNFPVPILIVQHISQGFTTGFVEWLKSTTLFPLYVASHGEFMLPGHAYVAPDDFHMGVENGPRIIFSNQKAINGLRPSVAYLFSTVAQVFGSKAVGVILTGMGHDGAEELKLMKDNGAITFAQDKDSSVVHGMPGEAIKLNAATYILSPEDITAALITLIKK